MHLLGAGFGKVHSVIFIFVLDICCQHLGYMRQLEGFYAPFGHKVRECTFCNIYIFVLDICYQQLGEMCQLEGFCAFFGCRPCTALQGEGTYIFVIYVFVLDICCQYLGNILSGGPAVRGPTV